MSIKKRSISTDNVMHLPNEIIRKADLALLKTRVDEKKVCYYDKTLEEEVKRKLLIETEIRSALSKGEFYILYQPIYDIKEGKVNEFEALLRWRNEKLGNVAPLEFIPIAEECGFIHDLGVFVFEEVCRQLSRWKKDLLELKVAVNISPIQLSDEKFLPILESILSRYKLSFRDIKFEITESQILSVESENAEILKKLLDRGSIVALDDFGVGFSSIKNLVFFPLSEIKIDKIFTLNIFNEPKIEIVAGALIYAAKWSGYVVTVEGVEKESQFQKFKKLGCDKVQGCYIGGPMFPERVISFLKKYKYKISM